MSYAIFKTGGKQFRAEAGTTLRIPSIEGEPGATVVFDNVLLGAKGDSIKTGTPMLDGAKVTGEIVKHGLGDKIIVFKFKRKKQYKKTIGHRQSFTEVKVGDILV